MKTRVLRQVKRYVLLCVGLTIMAFGVAFSIKAGLGTSPISSLPYVLSLLTPLTVGTATIAMHVALICLQILVLRRQYDPIQLMQLPAALIFGALTDFSVWALQGVSASSYPMQWVLCVVGILLVGVGVSFEVTANVVTLAGEGMVLALCKAFPLKFANTKVGFDVTLVVIATHPVPSLPGAVGRSAGGHRGGGSLRGRGGQAGQPPHGSLCRAVSVNHSPTARIRR